MKSKRVRRFGAILLSAILLVGCGRTEQKSSLSSFVKKIQESPVTAAVRSNENGVAFLVDGKEIDGLPYPSYMTMQGDVMMPVSAIQEVFSCSLRQLSDGTYQLRKDEKEYSIHAQEGRILFADEENEIYFPALKIANLLSYTYRWDYQENRLELSSYRKDETLPVRYDYRRDQRATVVKDQGQTNTCWAYAATTALETSLLPAVSKNFDAMHMTTGNSQGISVEEGGTHSMSLAYFLAGQGPVSTETGRIDVHVQEARIYENTDVETIKKAVYTYGGVETSIYFDQDSLTGTSAWYQDAAYAYCYQGEESVNHDVVIIGWDDTYPAENFTTSVPGDGAFICQNSWGSDFGENGVFYVSYYDQHVLDSAVVYSVVRDKSSYDTLYQTDLCGWVGQLGYGKEQAVFANAYTAGTEEKITACGFYATDENTTYTVSFVHDFSQTDDFSKAEEITSGTLSNAGYYTVAFPKDVMVSAGEKFAVLVQITTPGASQPAAVEYLTADVPGVDLSDGEGYLSYDGTDWISTEQEQQCNVCLKVYADTAQ